MGGGNGQKAKMARERNLEKSKAAKGSQLETNKKAMSIQVLCYYIHSLSILVSLFNNSNIFESWKYRFRIEVFIIGLYEAFNVVWLDLSVYIFTGNNHRVLDVYTRSWELCQNSVIRHSEHWRSICYSVFGARY